ncbi:MAG: hypothetical protein N4A63_00220 [Vallitalea sp.]|jgi:hypothetical protein|nr:hypothetical protein [Vallitalea sp.]
MRFIDYTKDCPLILDSDRNSELGSRIRYKGTILLHKIRKLYGMNTVKEMFNILVNMEQKKTSSFIEEVGQANSEVAEFLNNEIRK